MINNSKKMVISTKQCRKCGQEKPTSGPDAAFQRQSAAPDGLKNWCRLCMGLYSAERYEKNREKLLAKSRAWNEANPNKVKGYQKDYRDKQAQNEEN